MINIQSGAIFMISAPEKLLGKNAEKYQNK